MPEPRRNRTRNVVVDIETWDILKRWSVDYRMTMVRLIRELVQAEKTRQEVPAIRSNPSKEEQ